MEKKNTIILAVMVICLTGKTYAQEKSSWYLGFGIGTGDGSLENKYGYSDNISNAFGSGWNYSPRVAINFGVGSILNPKTHLGFELSAIRQDATYSSSGISGSASLQINNYMAIATYFPMISGFFVKGGAGLSYLQWEANASVPGYSEHISDTYSGMGIIGGIGYAFWIGETFNLCLHFDYSYQEYGEYIDNSNFYAVYISFYWF